MRRWRRQGATTPTTWTSVTTASQPFAEQNAGLPAVADRTSTSCECGAARPLGSPARRPRDGCICRSASALIQDVGPHHVTGSACTRPYIPASPTRPVGAAMTIVQDTLGSEILLDLSGARAQLAEARRDRAERDCAENRAVVAECHARIDSLLDLFLEISASRAGTQRPLCS